MNHRRSQNWNTNFDDLRKLRSRCASQQVSGVMWDFTITFCSIITAVSFFSHKNLYFYLHNFWWADGKKPQENHMEIMVQILSEVLDRRVDTMASFTNVIDSKITIFLITLHFILIVTSRYYVPHLHLLIIASVPFGLTFAEYESLYEVLLR